MQVNPSIPHTGRNGQAHTSDTIKFTVQDGIHFNAEFDQYEVWIDGEMDGGPFSFYRAAQYHYAEARRMRRERRERNRNNTTIFDTFVKVLSSGNVPLPKNMETIWKNGEVEINIFRRHDDRLVLICRRSKYNQVLSDPLAYLGSDICHISGPKAMWKLYDDARRKYEEWVAKAKDMPDRTFNETPGDGGFSDQDLASIKVDKNRWPWPSNVQEAQ